MGSAAGEGESPVGESMANRSGILSTTGHEEPCGKPGGPPPKAEYYPATDSEQVP